MRTWPSDVGLPQKEGDRAELRVVDLSLARAFFSGFPVARLLARLRLASDERDLATPLAGRATMSTWDARLTHLLGQTPAALERCKKAIARQTRAASDEGPLRASDAELAPLVFALAASADPDASAAEITGADGNLGRRATVDPPLLRACALHEPRLASSACDRRAILFEACARMTTRASVGPWPAERLAFAVLRLEGSELHLRLLRRSSAALYPLPFEGDIDAAHRRMALLERAELDVVVARDPRELASAIARSEHRGAREAHLDTLVADLTALLAHPGDLVLTVAPPDLSDDDDEPTPAPLPRPSWVPTDWSSADAIAALADALERGATTVPRVRGIVDRAGEPALDAIGAEMLRVASHPFANATFAHLLAQSRRPRDVIRLVTYFAITPDPEGAARALAACASPELPTVLRAWLEAMLPGDGAPVPSGENPDTSSAARLRDCVAALAPYPRLYGAVRPLLARVSEPPPEARSSGRGGGGAPSRIP